MDVESPPNRAPEYPLLVDILHAVKSLDGVFPFFFLDGVVGNKPQN